MDWIKREIYMKARQKLENNEEFFICNALLEILGEYSIYPECTENLRYEGGLSAKELYNCRKESILKEFFPEFMGLNDGKIWDPDGTYIEQHHIQDVWWSSFELWKGKPPRILILDTILRD